MTSEGSGGFNTIQGAIDFMPDHGTDRVTVHVKGGVYREIVYVRHKDNVTSGGRPLVRFG